MGNFMDDPLYPQRGQNGDSSSKSNVSFGDVTSGIGSIFGVIDSIFGISQRRQENAQKRLMEQQQQYWNQQNEILYNQQVEQWNRENEYNDPTNAYKRLLDGAEANGLSKAQVLNGAGSQVQSQSASGVSAPGSVATPSTSGAPVYSMGQGVMNSMRQLAEIDLMESQAEENRANAGLSGARTATEKEMQAVYQKTVQLYDEQIATHRQNRQFKDLQMVYQRIVNDYLPQEKEANLVNLWADTEVKQIQYRKGYKEISVFDQQFNASMSLLGAQERVAIASEGALRALETLRNEDARYKHITNETLEAVKQEELNALIIDNEFRALGHLTDATSSPFMLMGHFSYNQGVEYLLEKALNKYSKDNPSSDN